jgi:16S rRNA (guanine527-N7)-methyltransferase
MTGALSLEASLRAGIAALDIALTEAQVASLLAYQALLAKWNRVYNLTAVRDPADMLTHHLLDSLAAVGPLLRHADGAPLRLLDVGSGGGLPGIVFALCCPRVDVHCVDTVAKKAAFIQQAAVSLCLPNLHSVHARVETIKEPYDIVASRAFASLADFTKWSRGALADRGVWMAMKGKHPMDEIQQLPAETEVFHVEQLQVPGLAAERCIVWMRKFDKAA